MPATDTLGKALLVAPLLLNILASTASAEERSTPQLEEVVVTAMRRESTLQETPISLAAFDSERLEIEGINNIEDIGVKVPGMSITPFPTNASTMLIFIRGMGMTDSQITQDPPIALYIDGVYMARNVGVGADMADLQRIEVLRGPQGTLYGRNATGGAINMVTRRPDTEAPGIAYKYTAGNRNLSASRFTANLPVSDDLALKLAYIQSEKDGFVENHGPGEDWGDRDVEGYRLDLRWHLDKLLLDYAYDSADMRFVPITYQPVWRPVVKPGEDPISAQVREEGVRGAEQGSGYSDKRLSHIDSYAEVLPSSSDSFGHALTLTYRFDLTELKYIYGYRELDNSSYADLGSGAANENYRLDNNSWTAPDGKDHPLALYRTLQEQNSHELNLSGDAFDAQFNYILGAYYFAEEGIYNESPEHHLFHATLANSATLASLRERKQSINNSAWAIYGQATWTLPWLNERLNLTLGARHSQDSREAFSYHSVRNFLYQSVLPLPLPLAVPAGEEGYTAAVARDFKDNSFSAVVEFDLVEHVNLYAKVSEAYKSGGYNTRDPHLDANSEGNEFGFGFVDGFDEENILAYEVGIKSELFDRRLRLNADIFQTDIENMQMGFLVGSSLGETKVANAGLAQMRGFEGDLTWVLSHSVTLMLNYAYLATDVKEATNPATGADDSAKYHFGWAPEHSGTAALDWELWAAGWGRGSLHISYNYMGARYADNRADAGDALLMDAFSLWNARFSLADVPVANLGTLSLALWAKNLLEEEYVAGTIDALPHAARAVSWGEPRSYGVDINYRY